MHRNLAEQEALCLIKLHQYVRETMLEHEALTCSSIVSETDVRRYHDGSIQDRLRSHCSFPTSNPHSQILQSNAQAILLENFLNKPPYTGKYLPE